MKWTATGWVPAIVAALLGSGEISAQEPFTVMTTAHAIRIDGVLDDEAWKSATDLGPLTQREPREGSIPSEPTQVRLLIDGNNLYIGILNRDGEPSGIVRPASAGTMSTSLQAASPPTSGAPALTLASRPISRSIAFCSTTMSRGSRASTRGSDGS